MKLFYWTKGKKAIGRKEFFLSWIGTLVLLIIAMMIFLKIPPNWPFAMATVTLVTIVSINFFAAMGKRLTDLKMNNAWIAFYFCSNIFLKAFDKAVKKYDQNNMPTPDLIWLFILLIISYQIYLFYKLFFCKGK